MHVRPPCLFHVLCLTRGAGYLFYGLTQASELLLDLPRGLPLDAKMRVAQAKRTTNAQGARRGAQDASGARADQDRADLKALMENQRIMEKGRELRQGHANAPAQAHAPRARTAAAAAARGDRTNVRPSLLASQCFALNGPIVRRHAHRTAGAGNIADGSPSASAEAQARAASSRRQIGRLNLPMAARPQAPAQAAPTLDDTKALL
jgi:hypothetical protein